MVPREVVQAFRHFQSMKDRFGCLRPYVGHAEELLAAKFLLEIGDNVEQFSVRGQ